MKKITTKILMIALVTAVLSLDVSAQTRIRFARGRSSATVSGTLKKSGGKCFVLGASAGQSIEARLYSRSSDVQFPFYFGAGPYKGGKSYGWTAVNGDNEICIENHGKATAFRLVVSIS